MGKGKIRGEQIVVGRCTGQTRRHSLGTSDPSEWRDSVLPALRNARSNIVEQLNSKVRAEAVLPKGVRIIALDERGRDLTSVGLSQQLETWQRDGRDTAFLIGGADGLDPELKARAEGLIRISSMTLPHGMVRVMLAEQLYRAWSITQNHPYHRV